MLRSAQPGVITASSACLAEKHCVFAPSETFQDYSSRRGEQYVGLSDYGTEKAKRLLACFSQLNLSVLKDQSRGGNF